MTKRKKNDGADLPRWLVELLDAGSELARLVQAQIDAASHQESRDHQEKIIAWARAVVAARKANAFKQRCFCVGRGYVISCAACGLVLREEKEAGRG